MRNSPDGCIWQAYTVANEQERRILTSNAKANGFLVEQQPDGYTEETTPGWRDTPDWKKCLELDANKKP